MSLLQETATIKNYELIGEGLQTYFGPVHRVIFCVPYEYNLTTGITTYASNISLQIQTSRYPFGGGSQEDRNLEPAQKLFEKLQAIFSTDVATAHAAALSLLNSQLTHALTEENGAYEIELDRTQKVLRNDKQRHHPGVVFTVAAWNASKPYQRNHADFDEIIAEAEKLKSKEETARIKQITAILSQPNVGIEIVQERGHGSDILLGGEGLMLALDKLLVTGLVINDSDLFYLRADLVDWKSTHSSHPATGSVNAVLDVFEKYDPTCRKEGARMRPVGRCKTVLNAG